MYRQVLRMCRRFYKTKSPLISQVLEAKPSKREAQAFLNEYLPLNALSIDEIPVFKNKIAIICIESLLSSKSLELVGATIKNLQTLGLYVVGVPMFESEPEKATAYNLILELANAIENKGGRAMPLYQDALALEEYDYFASVHSAFNMGRVPLLLPFTCNLKGQNSFQKPRKFLNLLASKLIQDRNVGTPSKLVFITEKGGLTTNSTHHKLVNLTQDFRYIHSRLDHSSDIFVMANDVMSILEPTASAIITSPSFSGLLIGNLVTERPFSVTQAFKNEDAPTVLRKGMNVFSTNKLSDINLDRLTSLLENSFQKKLKPEFWKSIAVDSVIIAGNYDGAAIITKHEHFYYLDKFSVASNRQGIGIADILWKKINSMYPTLFWRSRRNNPVNKWYFDRSDGNMAPQNSNWMIFWYGNQELSHLTKFVREIESIPPTF